MDVFESGGRGHGEPFHSRHPREGKNRERVRGRAVLVVMWRAIKRILHHPFRVFFNLCLIVAQNLIELMVPIFVGQIFLDNVLLRNPVDPERFTKLPQTRLVHKFIEPWQEAPPEKLLIVVICGLVTLSLIMYARWLLFVYLDWSLKNRLVHRLRTELMSHVVGLGARFHSSQRVGDLINRVQLDSNSIVQFYQQGISGPWMHLIKLSTALVSLVVLSPLLAAITLSVLPVALVLNFFLAVPLRRSARKARECESDLMSHIDGTLGSIRTVMAFAKEPEEARRYEGLSWHALSWRLRVEILQALLSRSVEQTVAFSRFSVFIVGAYAVWRGDISVGQWGVLTAYMQRIHQPLFALTEVWSRLQTQLIGLDRVFSYLDMKPEIQDSPNAKPLRKVRQGIEIKNITFEYDPGHPVLKNISIKSPIGSVTALVGPVGSGKSTLASMIPRFLDPKEGEILIDGVNIKEYTVASLRSHISYAMQENQLFPVSVLQNVLYGAPNRNGASMFDAAQALGELDDPTRMRVEECVDAACMNEFIEKLPEGYSTNVGERAVRLSGGERQRIAIARALLRDTSVLILDEPTAALDAETEEKLLENLQRLGKNRIIFIIAHRLATIRHADQICFLRNGELLEVGTHQELLSKIGGNYREFFEKQYKLKTDEEREGYFDSGSAEAGESMTQPLST